MTDVFVFRPKTANTTNCTANTTNCTSNSRIVHQIQELYSNCNSCTDSPKKIRKIQKIYWEDSQETESFCCTIIEQQIQLRNKLDSEKKGNFRIHGQYNYCILQTLNFSGHRPKKNRVHRRYNNCIYETLKILGPRKKK